MRRYSGPFVVLALGLASCSSESGSDWSSVFTMVKAYWNGPTAVPMQQAAAVPFASIGVRIGDGPQVLLVLASESQGERLWLAGERVAISTRDGRITHSAGLGHDLRGYLPASDLFGGGSPALWTTSRQTGWSVDYPDRGLYSVAIRCQLIPQGIEPVVLLGKTIRTLRVDENCSATALHWSFVNSYWVSPSSGFVWRSVQTIHPDLDPIEVETLRPPET